MSQLVQYIVFQTQLPKGSIKNTVQLLNEDCTIPFISRYRKEQTGNLDEVQIGDIVKYKELFEALEKRKNTILKTLAVQEELTAELQKKISEATDLITLEDLYLPYKKHAFQWYYKSTLGYPLLYLQFHHKVIIRV